MYPYHFKLNANKEPDLIKIYLRLHHADGRPTQIPNRNLAMKLTWQLKPIRPDVVIGPDSKYKQPTYISLKKGLKFDIKPLNNDKTIYDLLFNKLL